MSFNLVSSGSYPLQLHEISPITSNHGNPIGQHTSTHSNPIGQDMSIQSNPIGDGASTQSNPIGEGDSSGSHARTLLRRQWEVKATTRYKNFISKKKRATLSHPMQLKMCGKVGLNFGEILRLLRGQKKIQRIALVDEKSLVELKRQVLSQSESIARDLKLANIHCRKLASKSL
ncbi:hypothetical protein KY284_026272 [Solanum tuberosum]|nr:hypothetical protein KY284_026272 [Solanum tuberosum]